MTEGNSNPTNSRDLIKGALLKIEELQAELDLLRAEKNEPIAIIGMGCRLPGNVNNPKALWDLLANGIDAISEVPTTRWDINDLYDADLNAPGKINTRFGGFVGNVTDFDPEFFGISPREAASMDPQQRLLLEVCWEALENSNIDPHSLYGTPAGVFIGIIAYDYGQRVLGINRIKEIDAYAGTGSSLGVAAGRLSYILGLTGPSLSVDTACSSSLVTIHLACESLKRKECNVAIAGGVNLMLEPGLSINFSKAHMLAPDGKCKTFDAAADGYVRGEGCGIIILKRLSDALKANDPILAVVKGSAVNQDGASGGLTIPSGPSQAAVIKQALHNAKCKPNDVDYIEAHGTGTSLGDPIELGSLDQVFSSSRESNNPLFIGSIKTNIGHLEAAAGIAGIMKLILSLKHKKIPPHLNCSNPTSRFPWHTKPIKITQQLTDWPNANKSGIAGISSFGFSGTNAHVLLEEAPAKDLSNSGHQSTHKTQILNLSGHTPIALFELAKLYLAQLENAPQDIYQVCASTSQSRSYLQYRLSVLANDQNELKSHLSDFINGIDSPGVIYDNQNERVNQELAFLFTGQGSQYPGMGKELYETQSEFKKWIDHCESILRKFKDTPLTTLLFKADSETLNQSLYTQPALFCLEYALAKLWQSFGIEPSILIGHSLGEYVAATLAGVFSLEDAIAIIHKRASLMQALPKNGAMLAVAASQDELKPYLQKYFHSISIAAINSEKNCVISGNAQDVMAINEQLKLNKFACKTLPVSHAFHSQLMEPMLKEFEQFLSSFTLAKPQIPIISNLTGEYADHSISTAAYWVKHIRQTVQFSKSLEIIEANKIGICIEIGPNPVLSSLASERLGQQMFVPSLKQNIPADRQFLKSLGQLHQRGISVRWETLYPRASLSHISLPNYPFQRERFWIERVYGSTPEIASEKDHPLLGRRIELPGLPIHQVRYNNLIDCSKPYLKDHQVFSQAIFPATAYIELAVAGYLKNQNQLPLVISEFSIDQALLLSTDKRIHSQMIMDFEKQDASFQIYSSSENKSNPSDSWVSHCHGKIKALEQYTPIDKINLKMLAARFKEQVPPEDFYKDCNYRGINYGASFRLIKELWRSDCEALARIYLPDNACEDIQSFCIYPTVLDACLQSLLAILPSESMNEVWLPIGLENLTLFKPIERDIYCQVILKTTGNDSIQIANVLVTSATGEILCTIDKIKAKKVNPGQLSSSSKILDKLLYEIEWVPKPLPNQAPEKANSSTNPCWIIFSDMSGLGESLAEICQATGVQPILVTKGSSFIELDAHHYQINPIEPDSFDLLFEKLGQTAILQYIFLWGLDLSTTIEPDHLFSQDTFLAWASPLGLIQSLEKNNRNHHCKLTFITRNAFCHDKFSKPSLEFAPLIGVAKSISAEMPSMMCSVIDLEEVDFSTSLNQINSESDILLNELIQNPDADLEDQVMYRHQQRYVSRLKRAEYHHLPSTSSYQLTIPSSGSLADLSWQSCDRKAPLADEVEIEVHTTGLNFKDVLLALHHVNAMGDGLGVECAGKVSRVGPGVTQFAVGDRVLAMVPGSLSRFVCAPLATTALLPSGLEDAAAATIPITFLTAAYALENLAKVGPGDRVLIHAGTGGVGQAAIQIAQRLGAEVFATASQGKWPILRDLGVKHIFDSRTTKFESAIRQATQGQGVDVVLNSLRGEFTDASLRLLQPGGRFLEIGITDLRTPDQIERIAPGITYYPIDLMDLYRDERPILQSLLQELLKRFTHGELKPLPYQLYPASTVETAFRVMQQAKHTGKVVIDLHSQLNLVEGSYLIFGGTGDLGLALSKWLIQNGVKDIVLTGRTPPSQEKQKYIDQLRNGSVDIQFIQADAADPKDLQQLFTNLSKNKNRLRGIFHCAGVVDDATLGQQNRERFQKVMSPKVDSAWLIHQHSLNLDIDFLVLFSSATSMLGAPGQANYVTANLCLDLLAHYRRAYGLRTYAINWGAWDQIGLAARMQLQDHLAKQGIKPLDPSLAFDALAAIFDFNQAQVGAFEIDWPTFLSRNSRRSFFRNFSNEVTSDHEANQTITSSLLDTLKTLSHEDRLTFLQNHLSQRVAAVLGIPKSRKIDRLQGFFDMGMDSLTSVELKNRLSADFKLTLPATLAFDHPNISVLAQHLLSTLLDSDTLTQAKENQDNRAELGAIESLSEEEAEESLKQALREMGFENK